MSIIYGIIFIILTIIDIIANIIVIYIMCGKRNLRTVTNILFGNSIFAQSLFFIINFALAVILTKRSSTFSSHAFIHAQVALLVATVLSFFTVAIDWVLAAYFQRFSERFRKLYKIIIAAVWGLSLIGCIARVIGVFYLKIDILNCYYMFPYFLLLLFIIIVGIYRLIQKSRYSSLLLNLTSLWVVMNLPITIYTIIFLNASNLSITFFEIGGIIGNTITYSQPIITVLLLCCFYRNFQESSRNVFDCSRTSAIVRFDKSDENEQCVVSAPLNEDNRQKIMNNA